MKIRHARVETVNTANNLAVFSVIFEDIKGRKIPSRIVTISGNTGKVSPEIYQSLREDFLYEFVTELALLDFRERF